jgi:hypothetical protein
MKRKEFKNTKSMHPVFLEHIQGPSPQQRLEIS